MLALAFAQTTINIKGYVTSIIAKTSVKLQRTTTVLILAIVLRTTNIRIDCYINKILNRITLIGGVFLCIIAALPLVVSIVVNLFASVDLSELAFGGSSLLIVVGVALETVRELEAQITLRNYKGFLD